MNVLIVDTSYWISYFSGEDCDDLDLGLQEGRVYLPPVVLAELFSGKMNPGQIVQLEELLRELPLCNNDFDHWLRVGKLRRKLLAAGYTVSTPDAHIAQCALDLNGYLLTKDSIFKKIHKLISLKLL